MKTYRVTEDEYGTIHWYNENGQLHREDGPASEYANGTKLWYLNGQLHREDGPAIESADGDKKWWLNGQRHREDGPAIERADGYKEWYLNGEDLTEEEFDKRTQFHKEILNKINRVEYIDSEGRQLVRYGKHSFDIQDNGQTLKIFKEGKI